MPLRPKFCMCFQCKTNTEEGKYVDRTTFQTYQLHDQARVTQLEKERELHGARVAQDENPSTPEGENFDLDAAPSGLDSLTSEPNLSPPQPFEVPHNQGIEHQDEPLDANELEDVAPYDEMKSTIKHVLIRVQAEWDNKKMSIELQDYILDQMFSGLELPTKPGNEKLGDVFRKMPRDWKGDLECPSTTPSSFKRLLTIYKKWGMVEPQRWRMCLGIEQYAHEPILLAPSEDDIDERNAASRCGCTNPTKLK